MRVSALKGFILAGLFFTCIPNINAQVSKEEFEQLSSKVATLENENNILKSNVRAEIDDTKRRIEGYAPMFLLLFLYGTVCALWAQGTNRSAIAWFFSGMIFSVLTAITVMYINGKEQSDND
jgi:hypothetical protein